MHNSSPSLRQWQIKHFRDNSIASAQSVAFGQSIAFVQSVLHNIDTPNTPFTHSKTFAFLPRLTHRRRLTIEKHCGTFWHNLAHWRRLSNIAKGVYLLSGHLRSYLSLSVAIIATFKLSQDSQWLQRSMCMQWL